MIESMTGYGAAELQDDRYYVTVELKSLNSKALEMNLRMPTAYHQQEVLLRNQLSPLLVRGKITGTLSVEDRQPSEQAADASLNGPLLLAYHRYLSDLAARVGSPPPNLTDLLDLPDVQTPSARKVSEQEWKLVVEATKKAAEALRTNRRQEGARLETDFRMRLQNLEDMLESIAPWEAQRVPNIRQKLEQSLKELQNSVNYSEDRLHQELVFYLERLDVTEEQVRIRAHLAQFKSLLDGPESQGRQLLFLTQELWREINTLGNKANEVNIQQQVVRMKDELEKIKEQVMNVL